MKKFYFSALALMVLAASCTNEQLNVPETTGNAINFGTYLGRDVLTRTSVLTTGNLQSIGVFASYTKQDPYVSQSMNFMNNQEVTKSGSAWTYTPVKYWPNNDGDMVSFFAYAPYKDGTRLYGTKKPVIAESSLGSQDDLVVADAIKDKTKPEVGEKVSFTFKHALSRIGLNVEAMVDKVNDDETGTPDNGTVSSDALASETIIKVTEVKLVGKFDTEANIDLLTSTWSDVDVAGSDIEYKWVSSNFEDVANDVTTTKTQLNKADSYAMIIPQNFVEENKIKLVITYTVTTSDDNLEGSKSEITNTITSDPFNFNFVKGKAYMFNIHLGMTSVTLSAEVSLWDEVTPGTVVNLPININSRN